MNLPLPIDNKTLYVCNHSGGKDSQAMYIILKDIIPANQLIVIYSDLGKVEWEGSVEHIEKFINHEIFVVRANKTYFEMVLRTEHWPSPKFRQCTSDLKRGPIEKQIKEICNTRGFNRVISCIGLRAQESKNRALKEVFKLNNSETNTKREWYEWLPIHSFTLGQVLATRGHTVSDLKRRIALWWSGRIEEAKDGWSFHWVYLTGISRKSCKYCFLAKKRDLQISAKLNPELLEEYSDMEIKTGKTFIMPGHNGPKYLKEIVSGEVIFDEKENNQISIFDLLEA
jgi:DNA sulfur modification protein DndC